MAGGAVIEVGLNEATSRAIHPRVSYSPAECAADAARCADAGAAVVHWHARDPATGEQRLGDTDLYAEALAAMPRDRLLAYPSYPIEPTTADERLAHCWALRERLGLELVPVDVGSANLIMWNSVERRFEAVERSGVVANPLPFVLDALGRARQLGMIPSVGSFDVGATRTAVLLAESGALAEPVFLKILLSGSWAAGPFPTEDAIEFHLRQLPDSLDVEWVLVPHGIGDPGLVERLCRRALELGGGIRVGVGDNPLAASGRTNAELVEEAVRWAQEAGRPVASAAEVRERLGLPAGP